MNNTTPSNAGDRPEPVTPQQDTPATDSPTVAKHPGDPGDPGVPWQTRQEPPAPGAYGSASFGQPQHHTAAYETPPPNRDIPPPVVGYGSSVTPPSYSATNWPPGGHVATAPEHPRGRGGLIVGVAVLALLGGAIGGGAAGYVAGGAAAGRGSGQSSVDTVPSAKSAAAAPAGSVQAVAEKTTRSVVQLKVEGRAGVGSGSGVVISDDGLIMTNNHVVEGAAEGGRITAGFSDGAQAPVTIIGRAPSADLALVKASGVRNLRPAELGRSSDLAVGQNVVAIGSPFRLSGTVTSGIISALNRPVKAGDDRESVATVLDAIQTDAAINPGNSGGPLIDMQGRVIGVNSAIYSPSSGGEAAAGSVGLGFAIPIDSARRIVKELQDKGQATQAVLGVTVGDVEQGGASVRSVTPGGAADKAGIKAGDVITAVGDRRVEGRDALVAAVRSHQPGDKVSLKVYSGGGERTVEVPLGSEVIGGR